MATPKQIGFIHGLAGRLKMDEDTRRAFLKREAGVNSCKLLTAAKAATIIDKMRDLAGDAGRGAGAVAGLNTPVAKKLRALWIAGHNLGLVRDRSDRAMLSYLERQTGVSHTRFLGEPGAGTAAIEGLKSWLARDGKVAWPESTDVIAAKHSVLCAQWMQLVAIGAVKPFVAHMPLTDLDAYAYRVVGKNGWCFFDGGDYDQVQAALGRKLRAALINRGKSA
jgi:hypothetical protein